MRIRLPHTVIWRRHTDSSGWEGDTYAEAVTIPARVERRTRIARSTAGEERVDDTRILVGPDTPVRAEDLLDDERVEGVDEQVSLSGDVVGYIAHLEA